MDGENQDGEVSLCQRAPSHPFSSPSFESIDLKVYHPPCLEPVLMIKEGSECLAISGAKAWHIFITPYMLTPRILSQPSSDRVEVEPPTPAFAMRTVRVESLNTLLSERVEAEGWKERFRLAKRGQTERLVRKFKVEPSSWKRLKEITHPKALDLKASTDSFLETSTCRAMTLAPGTSSATLLTAGWRLSLSMSPMTTVIPAVGRERERERRRDETQSASLVHLPITTSYLPFASFFATAKPIPEAPPVQTASFPGWMAAWIEELMMKFGLVVVVEGKKISDEDRVEGFSIVRLQAFKQHQSE